MQDGSMNLRELAPEEIVRALFHGCIFDVIVISKVSFEKYQTNCGVIERRDLYPQEETERLDGDIQLYIARLQDALADLRGS